MKNQKKEIRISIIVAISALFFVLAIGTFVYPILEGWTYIQSFYFSVVTLLTVGYGDFVPSSEFSRLFTAIYLLMGVGVVAGAVTMIANNFLKQRELKMEKRIRGKQTKDNSIE